MNQKTTEMEVHVSGGRILRADVTDNNNITTKYATVNIVKKQDKPEIIDGKFRLVPASELSVDDDFLQYQFMTGDEGLFYSRLVKAICKKPKNFYRPIYDPSFDKGGNIIFDKGNMPAIGRSFNWWKEKTEKMTPVEGMNFYAGSKTEYIIFLGYLMKTLYEKGLNLREVWSLVCKDSADLGNFKNFENTEIKMTGSNEVCGWHDLGNTTKIIDIGRKYKFSLAGGNYMTLSYNTPLADITQSIYTGMPFDTAVGWLVLK